MLYLQAVEKVATNNEVSIRQGGWFPFNFKVNYEIIRYDGLITDAEANRAGIVAIIVFAKH